MMIKQLFFILASLFLGYSITLGLHLPLPSNVVGFAILFGALCLGLIKVQQVEQISYFIIKYLAVFFVVPSVGFMQCFGLIKEQFIYIIIPLVISIILGFFTAAKVTELLIRRSEKKALTAERVDHGDANVS